MCALISGFRCIKDPYSIDQSLCLKILDTAWKSDNRQTKYTVYSHLHDVLKVHCMESTSRFFCNCFSRFTFFSSLLDEQFEKYAKEFKALFDSGEIEEAEDRFRLARISSTPVSINSLVHDSSFEAHSFSSFRE